MKRVAVVIIAAVLLVATAEPLPTLPCDTDTDCEERNPHLVHEPTPAELGWFIGGAR